LKAELGSRSGKLGHVVRGVNLAALSNAHDEIVKDSSD
jgi:hypothetical protein